MNDLQINHHPHLEAASNTYTCDRCGDSFDCPKKAAEHENNHGPSHVCEHCGRSFRYALTLQSHQFKAHKLPIRRMMQCEYCSKCFYQEGRLREHTEYCHLARHLKCKNCNNVFESEEMLHEHGSKCEKNASPSLGSRSSKKSDHLLLRIASSEDSLSNDQNQNQHQGFPDAANNLHQASFTLVLLKDSLLLSCGICKFYLRNKMNRCKMHMKTDHPHLEVARYAFTCGSCSDSFDCSLMAAKHYREIHKMKRFICEKCDKTFLNDQSLQSHQRRVHHLKRFLQCQYCSNKYHCTTNFEEHRKYCTSTTYHFCKNCYSVFESKEMLHEHGFKCNENADPGLHSGYDLQLLDDLLDTLN